MKQLKVLGFVALLFTLGACSVSPTDSSWLDAVKGKKVVSGPVTVATFSTDGKTIEITDTSLAYIFDKAESATAATYIISGVPFKFSIKENNILRMDGVGTEGLGDLGTLQ